MQGLINEALNKIAGHPIETTGSGRTDTGVHAEQQFFHLNIEKQIEPNLLMHKLNTMLPRDIAIKNIYPVQGNQHARFALSKMLWLCHIQSDPHPFLPYWNTQNPSGEVATLLLYSFVEPGSASNEVFSLVIKRAGEEDITIKAYPHPKYSWILNSSLNQDAYFSEQGADLLPKIFKGQQELL